MKIGDEILVKAKVVDFDANPHGAAVKVKVKGFVDRDTDNKLFGDQVIFWIHRLDQPKVITRTTEKERLL